MRQDEPGDTSVLTVLFRHNTWANLKLLDFCARLSEEQLDTTAIGGFGSIRDTLVHIVGSEVGYANNGKGGPRVARPSRATGFAVVKDMVRRAGDDLLELAIAARADTIVRHPPRDGLIEEYPLASLMVQVITHATEHRTQIAAIITQLGLEPPDMSAWGYMEEIGELKFLEPGAPAEAG